MVITKGEYIVLMLILVVAGGIITFVVLTTPGNQSFLALLGGLLIGSGTVGLALC